jgi:hypothetical protein
MGVSLPAYEDCGMLFGLDTSGAPRDAVRLDGMIEPPNLKPLREMTIGRVLKTAG